MGRPRNSVVVLVGAASAVVLAVSVASCGSSHQSAPDPGGVAGSKSIVLQMPNGFRNVAISCQGTTGVYVTSRSLTADLSSGVAVLANDPYCTGK